MGSDLTERLRDKAQRNSLWPNEMIEWQAADEITALRTQVSRLTADLEVARASLIDHLQYMKKPESAPIIQRIDATLNTIRKDG